VDFFSKPYLYFLSLPEINAQASMIVFVNYHASSTTCGMWASSLRISNARASLPEKFEFAFRERF
jgi:hypothetical protein